MIKFIQRKAAVIHDRNLSKNNQDYFSNDPQWGEQDYFMIRRVGTLRPFLKQKNAQVNLAFFLI